MKEINLDKLKKMNPNHKKKQKIDSDWSKHKPALRRKIENSITVYDSYDETNGDYGKTPPTVITEM